MDVKVRKSFFVKSSLFLYPEVLFVIFQQSFHSVTACACDINGAIGSSCDTITGKCQCKRFVEGDKCDKCFVSFV